MTTPTAAAIYCRISDDPGTALGVARQEQDCRALAERKGWPVAEVYVDNDRSAWSRNTKRPEYLRMLEDMKGARIDAVLVYDLDRLHRQPAELEEFFVVCDAAGVTHLASVSGDVDLGTDDGRFLARILGAVARKESDDKSRRIRRKMTELAESGEWKGGGTRPFGYQADRTTVDEAEAELIREAAQRVLAGESLPRSSATGPSGASPPCGASASGTPAPSAGCSAPHVSPACVSTKAA